MRTDALNRRRLMALLAAAGSTTLAAPTWALSSGQAEGLITNVVNDINRIINSGKSEGAMIRDFERLFGKYADVPTIAASSLGVARRSASSSQMRAYTSAFSGYIARKYGARFREFIGADIQVVRSQKTKRGYLVTSRVNLRGQAPFAVSFMVSDRNLFFDLLIEGISLLKSERAEIGAMLDKRRGDIAALVADLKKAG